MGRFAGASSAIGAGWRWRPMPGAIFKIPFRAFPGRILSQPALNRHAIVRVRPASGGSAFLFADLRLATRLNRRDGGADLA